MNRIDQLISFFEQYVKLTPEERDYLNLHIPIQQFNKDELLLKEGQISTAFFFVIEGSVRMYYETEIGEKSAYFYFENAFVSSYESFTKNVPAKHNLQAIEDTVVAVIDQQNAYQLVVNYPKFEFLARIMMEEELIVYQRIISMFIMHNAEQRYLHLLNSGDQILQRVPQHQLATFLGVTPETLSRIRKRLSAKDRS